MDNEAKAETRAPQVEPPSRAAAWKSRLARLKGPLVAVAAVGTILGGLAGYWNGWRAVRSGMAEANISPSKPGDSGPPHAASDRRMIFAVLPFQAPTGDADGARLALAAFELLQSAQEAKVLWGASCRARWSSSRWHDRRPWVNWGARSTCTSSTAAT